MIFPAQYLTEVVEVEAYAGEGAYGPSFAAPVSTFCQLEAGRKLVRSYAGGGSGDSGDEIVSDTTLRLSPDLDPSLDLEALFVPESRVKVRGRESRVITASPKLVRGRLVYLEVTLT